MGIENYIDVTVTKEGAIVTRQGFGVIAFINDNTVQNAGTRVQLYSTLEEIVDAGFLTSSQFYKWAQVVFSQTPAPNQVASLWWDDSNAETLADALDDAQDSNGADFYFLNLDSRLDADISAVAAWAEAQKKVFIAQSDAADILTSTEPNIANTLQTANYKRTALIWHADDAEFADGAWTGLGAAADLDSTNGVITWAYKQLAGVTSNELTTTQYNNILAYDANTYTTVGGVGVTTKGTSAEGQFIDVATTLDWTYFRILEALFSVLVGTSTKIPYTDAGIAQFLNTLESVMRRGQVYGHFDPSTAVTVTAPLVKNIDKNLIEQRILPDLLATARLSGAIHKVIVKAKVSV
jgi:hypothetical protein